MVRVLGVRAASVPSEPVRIGAMSGQKFPQLIACGRRVVNSLREFVICPTLTRPPQLRPPTPSHMLAEKLGVGVERVGKVEAGWLPVTVEGVGEWKGGRKGGGVVAEAPAPGRSEQWSAQHV